MVGIDVISGVATVRLDQHLGARCAAVQMIDTSVVRVHRHGLVSLAIKSNIWAVREG